MFHNKRCQKKTKKKIREKIFTTYTTDPLFLKNLKKDQKHDRKMGKRLTDSLQE